MCVGKSPALSGFQVFVYFSRLQIQNITKTFNFSRSSSASHNERCIRKIHQPKLSGAKGNDGHVRCTYVKLRAAVRISSTSIHSPVYHVLVSFWWRIVKGSHCQREHEVRPLKASTRYKGQLTVTVIIAVTIYLVMFSVTVHIPITSVIFEQHIVCGWYFAVDHFNI